MRVRSQAPAWVAAPAGVTFLWLMFGVRAVAVAVVVTVALVLIGVVWPLERDQRIVRLR